MKDLKTGGAIMVLVCLITLAACARPSTEWGQKEISLKSIKGFENCQMNRVFTGQRQLYLVRCPNSSVSVNENGKHPDTSITSDSSSSTSNDSCCTKVN